MDHRNKDYALVPSFADQTPLPDSSVQGTLFTGGHFPEIPGAHDALVSSIEATNGLEQPPIAGKAEWHDRYDQMVSNAQRTGEPLSALFADIDGFKDINDKFGHLEGDKTIVKLQEMFSQLPHTPGHVGGDEFALAAPVDAEGIRSIKEQAEAAFAEVLSRPENAHLRELGIGISIGAATLEADMTGAQLLERADAAMYEAKLEHSNLTEKQKAAFYAAQVIFKNAGIRLRDVSKLAGKYPLAEEDDSL